MEEGLEIDDNQVEDLEDVDNHDKVAALYMIAALMTILTLTKIFTLP